MINGMRYLQNNSRMITDASGKYHTNPDPKQTAHASKPPKQTYGTISTFYLFLSIFFEFIVLILLIEGIKCF